MSSDEFVVKVFDKSHFDVVGVISDVWKAVARLLVGFADSCRFDHVYHLWRKEPRLKPILLSCLMLNLVYLLVMVFVEQFLLVWLTSISESIISPVLSSEEDDGRFVLYIFQAVGYWSAWVLYELLWAVPMFAASFWRSNKYYTELAELVPPPTNVLKRSTTDKTGESSANTLVALISDGVSYALQLMFLKVANSLVSLIPYTGWYLSAILQCLLASFYAFESHWNRCRPDQSPSAFIAFMERDWSYFLGFGILLTAATIQLPVFMSLALYAGILPIFIVVAARPDAAAWHRTAQKPTFRVLPQTIRYFDMGHKLVDLTLIWIQYQISSRTRRKRE